MPSKDILSLSITKDFLKTLGGEDLVKLVFICSSKNKNVTDEEIRKHLKHLKVTEVRTLLNRLHFQGIATYQKKRDKKSGWYSYTWEIKDKRIAKLILDQQAEKLAKLEKQVSFETGHDFFSCKNKCDNVVFEIAAEYNFRCPECNETMNLVESVQRGKDVQRKINVIKKELAIVKNIAK